MQCRTREYSSGSRGKIKISQKAACWVATSQPLGMVRKKVRGSDEGAGRGLDIIIEQKNSLDHTTLKNVVARRRVL